MELINGLKAETEILHHIVFGSFDSKDFDLFLSARSAPTPSEQQVTVSVPYRQGVIDLSGIRGERVYGNREISYTFYRFGLSKNAEAGMVQTTLENLLMGELDQTLHDSYEPFFHYKGKCTGVSVQDDFEYGRLVIEITFELYPLKSSNAPESWDLFDSFNFNLDVMQPSAWKRTVTNNQTLQVINPGKNACTLMITSNKAGTIKVSADSSFTEADSEYPVAAGSGNRVRLLPGENWLQWTGTSAQMTLDLYKELI